VRATTTFAKPGLRVAFPNRAEGGPPSHAPGVGRETRMNRSNGGAA
jgi:hypothetical protein